MTKHQERAVEWLRTEILKRDGLASDRYEYKQFDVTDNAASGLVFVIAEVGLKNDENTMAGLLCRTHRHIVIGKRGALKLLNAKTKAHARGSSVVWAATR